MKQFITLLEEKVLHRMSKGFVSQLIYSIEPYNPYYAILKVSDFGCLLQ